MDAGYVDLGHDTCIAAKFLVAIEARFLALNDHQVLQDLRNSHSIAQEYLLITNCVTIARLLEYIMKYMTSDFEKTDTPK